MNTVSPVMQTGKSKAVTQSKQSTESIAQMPTITCHLITDDKGTPALAFLGRNSMRVATLARIVAAMQRPKNA